MGTNIRFSVKTKPFMKVIQEDMLGIISITPIHVWIVCYVLNGLTSNFTLNTKGHVLNNIE